VTIVLDLDATGESMWRDLMGDWGDQTRHDRFVQHCLSIGRLAAAGARYREHLDNHAEEPSAPIARRMQERVVFLSLQTLRPSSRGQMTSHLMQSPWFVAIVLFGATLGAVLGLVCGARR
jgi:hypothetical protein